MRPNRNQMNTRCAPVEDRTRIWQAAVEATQRHINLAKVFQDAGIKHLQRLQSGNAEDFAEEYQACLINLEKGTKIEREANRELIELYNIQPK